jgi:hypothetical protein
MLQVASLTEICLPVCSSEGMERLSRYCEHRVRVRTHTHTHAHTHTHTHTHTHAHAHIHTHTHTHTHIHTHTHTYMHTRTHMFPGSTFSSSCPHFLSLYLFTPYPRSFPLPARLYTTDTGTVGDRSPVSTGAPCQSARSKVAQAITVQNGMWLYGPPPPDHRTPLPQLPPPPHLLPIPPPPVSFAPSPIGTAVPDTNRSIVIPLRPTGPRHPTCTARPYDSMKLSSCKPWLHCVTSKPTKKSPPTIATKNPKHSGIPEKLHLKSPDSENLSVYHGITRWIP